MWVMIRFLNEHVNRLSKHISTLVTLAETKSEGQWKLELSDTATIDTKATIHDTE